MKNIFLINHPLSNAIAERIISHNEFDKADCVYIKTRIYEPRNNGVITYTSSFGKYRYNYVWWKGIKRIERFIDRIVGNQSFHAYTCQTISPVTQVILTMKKCEGYFIVEDGMGAYAERHLKLRRFQSPREVLIYLRNFFFSFGRLGIIGRIHFNTRSKKFKGTYVITKFAMEGVGNRVVLGLPFEVCKIIEKIRVIWIFDGNKMMKVYQIKSALENLVFNHLKSEFPVVHYKFHPADSEEIRAEYQKFFEFLKSKYNVEFIKLDDSIVIENIAFTLREELNIYCLISSIGFYASLCGCNSYSIAKPFFEVIPRLESWYNNLNDYAKRHLKLIN